MTMKRIAATVHTLRRAARARAVVPLALAVAEREKTKDHACPTDRALEL